MDPKMRDFQKNKPEKNLKFVCINSKICLHHALMIIWATRNANIIMARIIKINITSKTNPFLSENKDLCEYLTVIKEQKNRV